MLKSITDRLLGLPKRCMLVEQRRLTPKETARVIDRVLHARSPHGTFVVRFDHEGLILINGVNALVGERPIGIKPHSYLIQQGHGASTCR